METIQEEQLIIKARKGNKDAIRTLFSKYEKLVYSSLWRYYSVNSSLVREMIESSETIFWDALNKFDPLKGKFSTFLYDWFRWSFLNQNRRDKSHFTDSFETFTDNTGNCFIENHLQDPETSYMWGMSTSGDPHDSPCETSSRMEILNLIKNDLEKEDERTKTIMSMRYSCKENGKPYTLQEIGNAVGLSHEGVRLIHDKVITKLQKKYV
jgi:RNA polymerase sigma factor (sigma-70 family)